MKDAAEPGGQIPTRLIEILSGDGVKLIHDEVMDYRALQIPYATLSYRWNTQEAPKLTRANFEQWSYYLPMTNLPRIFQDAVNATECLGLRHIWIDALCIIQDDPDDWKYESALMGDVYQNAHMNLAASPAATEGAGTVELYTWPSISGAPTRRGWVMQERLLSRRTVYFSTQLNRELPISFTSIECPGRIVNLLPSQSHSGNEPQAINVISGQSLLYYSWLWLVQEYMRCNLTVAIDRLPTISGLARHFYQVFPQEYVAGLWREDLLYGLLWCRNWPSTDDQLQRDYIGTCPLVTRTSRETFAIAKRKRKAPSWPWTSAQGTLPAPT
ncbi:HET-domain-containing protein [Bimuria novae-zelandiae CBS 107.79]|uniref:HET-domain-containing protein n=1 Tax=Bimuria novae-zelandiae CBS 107.79 TaxID=1447943 RepID=A0A6A5VRD4_9PLEO|nr:HET-domain-containing protein [Bimuria novae-zelandiae CBS 107.79]